MKIWLLTCYAVCGPLLMSAQPQTYTFSKQNDLVTFVSNSDSITFPAYKKVNRKTSEKTVTINDASYRFILKNSKHGKTQEVRDQSGNLVATVFLSGVNENNIVFADGSELKFKRTAKTNWAYFVGEKEVAKSFYYMEDKVKKFVVHSYDSTISSPVFPAISLDYGVKNSRSVTSSRKTTWGVAIGVGAMLALVRLAADASDDDL